MLIYVVCSFSPLPTIWYCLSPLIFLFHVFFWFCFILRKSLCKYCTPTVLFFYLPQLKTLVDLGGSVEEVGAAVLDATFWEAVCPPLLLLFLFYSDCCVVELFSLYNIDFSLLCNLFYFPTNFFYFQHIDTEAS